MIVRAAVLDTRGAPSPYAVSRPLRVRELLLAPPGDGEVLVNIKAAGLCHSDLSVINGDRPRPTPMALGHEAAGIVVEVGAGVDDLQPGDHVVMVFMPSCGHCPCCAEGRPALCEPGAVANGHGTLLSGSIRLSDPSRGGETVYHHLGCSAFADHAVVSRRSLVKVDNALSFEEAALFGCAVLTGVGAVVNTARVQAGESVVIVGIGLAALLGAIAAGASTVVAVDLSDEKLALAQDLGATGVVNARDLDAVDQVRRLTGGGGDHAFEFAGSAQALDSAYRMTKRGGTTVTAGLPPPQATVPVNIVSMVAEERTFKGSYIGACVPSRDIPRYVSLYRAGRLPVDRLVSGTIKLDDINEGFDRLHAGSVVRLLILFNDQD